MIKAFPFFFLILIVCKQAVGQTIQLNKSDTSLFQANKSKSVEYEITLKFTLVGKAMAMHANLKLNYLRSIPVEFMASSDSSNQTTNGQNMKINFSTNDFPKDGDPIEKVVEKKILLKVDSSKVDDSVLVSINLEDLPGNNFVSKCTDCNYLIKFLKPLKNNKIDKKQTDLFYLNAYNFNLNGPLKSNYLGQFSFFNHQIGSSKFALDAGFMFINYSIADADSSQNLYIQKILLDPLLDTIHAGQKYLKQLNRFNTKPQNSSFSIFAHPMFCLYKSDFLEIYGHLHLELLINKTFINTSITNIKTDTLATTADLPVDSSFFRYVPSTFSTNSTLLNGYFGVGATFYVKLWDSAHFFWQGTFGRTSDYPQYGSDNSLFALAQQVPQNPTTLNSNSGNGSSSNSLATINKLKAVVPKGTWFYLVSGYLNQDISKSVKLLVGAQIRGFTKYSPYFAVYAGINLDIQSLVNVLK